ncbi:WxL domain-containing protein [Enterococcus faecalis]|uniref:WxL domain-containing protein n=1 Tax=Enterococcus faecalis TaxID=1351 RepID=UPI003CC58BD2
MGLCSSLVINAFSGVTAVAETITIESSPTVASSAKEATSASSATPASTESSQETTEASREEVTQETEKPEELREDELRNKSQIKDNNSLRSSGTRALAQMPYRAFTIYFVSEDGSFIDPSLINMSANIMTFNQTALGTDPSVYSPSIRQPISIIDAVDHKKFDVAAASYTYSTNSVFPRNFRGVSDIKITVPKKYSDLTVKPTNYYSSSKSYPLPVYTTTSLLSGTVQSSDSSGSLYELTKAAEPNTFRENYDNRTSYGVDKSPVSFGYYLGDASGVTNLIFGTTTPIYYYLTNRRVTESFKDTAGATIPAPTGFTQGKQTSITSNNYTFKQAGTLPETYKASNGKTYKFKGWYKGKTKPNTLTTTKAPSYAVTYDDNDDLNVVYEEIEAFDFPALTYQFGFVDESGKRVDASTIKLTYDTWFGEGQSTANVPSDWKTISLEKGKVAPTKNNLKEIAYPAQSFEIVSGKSSQYSAANLTFTPPRYYEKMSVYNKSGGFDTAYPLPTVQEHHTTPASPILLTEDANKSLSQRFDLKKNGLQSFIFNRSTEAASIDVQVPSYLRAVVRNPDEISDKAFYYTIDKPIYYYLTNRRVTENFVDTNGTKITPPTGFTQGKQTVINSDPYTFKQSGTLPDTYQADGKTYKFKGWYKGKSIINTLTTTKAPSYAVTYDDNDDLNVVYEEVTETAVYPGFYAQFVDEQGKAFTNPLTLSGNYTEYLRKTGTTVFETKGAFYPMTGKRDTTVTNKYKIETTSSVAVPNNYWTAMPADIANRGYALNNLAITNQMKYVDKIETTDTYTTAFDYAEIADIGVKLNYASQRELNAIDKTFVKQADNTFAIKSIWGNGTFSQIVPRMLVLDRSGSVSRLFGFDGTPDYKHTMNYTVTRKQVTENFVNTNGTKITPPTGFTQGNQIPMTSNTFKYTSAKALPASYTTGGKTYIFQGWYKGKTKPNTLTTSTTPTYNTTFDGNDDMTAMYKEEVPKASVALTRTTAETVTSGGNVTWRATITNTSQAPLTTATIKKSTAWTIGLAAPTAMIVTPAGGTAKTVPVTATTWTNGVSLGTDIPVGKSATVQFTTKATGTAGQVLRAGITTSGNYSGVSASATVRVKDNDQAIVTPTAEGFISVPTFNFGQVGVAGSTQQHSLKKAADYYGNGTRNPYLRIKKTQPNWSLTAQLSQPKSATDSLPTATRLLLGAAPVSSFSNYNQPTELKNAVGTTSAISLNANNTATRIIANQQFTGSNIYQLDFTFNNVKLEVPANQGVKGQQYQAAVTWNLVTGP